MTTQCSTPVDTTTTSRYDAPSDGQRSVRAPSWAPIGALAFGLATLVGSEFLPASVLPAMAADIGVSEGVAGLAVAATAVAGAVTARRSLWCSHGPIDGSC